MENNNKATSTIKFTDKALTFLSEHANLNESESVKAFIAKLETSSSYKRNLIIAYNHYCKYYQIQWKMPIYEQVQQEIKLAPKEKLLMLIANASKTLALKLTISMKTGLRPIELCRLKVKDIDTDNKAITPITAKHGRARSIKISSDLLTRIQEHMTRNKLQPNDNLFKGNADMYGNKYRTMRNKLAQKLNDPTIKNIRLYDFRHYFGSYTLRETNNSYFTMVQMGHRHLTTTERYLHLLTDDDPQYIVESTKNEKRADELIAKNFEYVLTTPDGHMKFRKRK
jgi:integrase